MQGKHLLATMSGVSALFISMSSYAVMSVPFGWYLEGNVGSSHLSGKSYPGNAGSSGIGGNANLGYKFMPYVGVEIGYTRYSNTSINTRTGTKAGTDKHYSYNVALRGILPIGNSGFEAFGKIGPERVNSHMNINNGKAANSIGLTASQHSATGLYLGAGLQYYWVPELAINVQWQRANGNSGTGTFDLFSGGLSFIFD